MPPASRIARLWFIALMIVALAVIASVAPASAQFQLTVEEIGPKRSSLHPSDPDGASGGRVNGLAVARTDRNFDVRGERVGRPVPQHRRRSELAPRPWPRIRCDVGC